MQNNYFAVIPINGNELITRQYDFSTNALKLNIFKPVQKLTIFHTYVFSFLVNLILSKFY